MPPVATAVETLTVDQVAALTGVKYSAVCRTASRVIGDGHGTGQRRTYTFRDATIIRAVSDLNGRGSDEKKINGQIYREILALLALTREGSETVTVTLGPITVTYRPTWYGPEDLY